MNHVIMRKSLPPLPAAAAAVMLLLCAGFQPEPAGDSTAVVPADLTLWYDRPANNSKPMDEALAIGNGRMGGLIFGAPARERISINEDSLWTGGENPSGNDNSMGAYQVFGNLYVNLPEHTNTGAYRRDLDLATARRMSLTRLAASSSSASFFAAIPPACSWPGSAPTNRAATPAPSGWLIRTARGHRGRRPAGRFGQAQQRSQI